MQGGALVRAIQLALCVKPYMVLSAPARHDSWRPAHGQARSRAGGHSSWPLGLACLAILTAAAAEEPRIEARLKPPDQGVIDIVLRSDGERQLDSRWESPTSPFKANASRLLISGDQEVWRLEVEEGFAERETFLDWHVGPGAEVLETRVYPALQASRADSGVALPDSLLDMESGLSRSTGKVPFRNQLDVAALRMIATRAALLGAGDFDIDLQSASSAKSPETMFPSVLRAAPPTFMIELDSEPQLAVVTDSQQRAGAWIVNAKLVGKEPGALQLYVSNQGVTGFGQTPTRAFLVTSEETGRAVSVSIPADVPDHPAADVGSGNAAADDPTPANVVVGQNACKQPFTHALDLQDAPTTGSKVTVDVLFVAAADAGFMLKFTPALLESLNQSVESSEVPVTFKRVRELTTTYQPNCSSTDACWYRMCDDLVSGRGGLEVAHTQRDELKADVVVLLVADARYRGLAADIGASKHRAFIVLGPSGVPYHSLGHELTHLAGGLHNQECESEKKFPRHGFVRPDRTFATIMATTCSAHKFTGLRQPFWGAAARVFPDGSPMTADGCCDEARVLASGALRLSRFR